MKRNDVYNRAEEFFRANINSELQSDVDWECWETGALAVIAVYLQQDLKAISFRQIYNHCQYRELVRLAELFTWSGTDDDVQTLLHVCRNRTAHKKFFSVVKASFENKNGFVPYFGEITEDEPTEEQKLEQAELKGFADGHSFSRKKFYEGVCAGLGGAALAVVLATCFFKFN